MKMSVRVLSLGMMLLAGLLVLSGCESYDADEYYSHDETESEGDVVGTPDPGEESWRGPSEIPSHWNWAWGNNINHWPVTINLMSASVNRGSSVHYVTVRYDRLQDVPAYYVPGDPDNIHNVNGSIWLVREYQGQMYIGTIDYLRVGQTTKEFDSSPAFLFTPQPGDRVGFMVSTMQRSYNGTIVHGDPNSPYQERSNIVWLTW